MKRILIIIFVFFTITSVRFNANDINAQTDVVLEISTFKVRSSEIIQIASNAIDKCFRNVAEGKSVKNFPETPGPMNTNFPKKKRFEYKKIIGFEYSEDNARCVTFLIGPDDVKGHHLAVVIDLRNMKVQKVYNYPGS